MERDIQKASVNGIEMAYSIHGEGEPLVLLMGFGADGGVWELHLNEYQKHFKCIVIDNRGVGLTSQPKGPYSTAMMADDVAELMDHLNIPQAKVAGISMGGAIAQELALRHPQKVERLCLIATWAKFNNYATTVYENLKKIRSQCSLDAFMELLQLWIFAPPFYEGEGNLATLQEGQKGYAAQPSPQTQDGFEGQLDACIGHDAVDRLGEITCPTLVVVGDQDIFTPFEFSRLIHEKIPGSNLLVLPGTGHVCHWESIEIFNPKTAEFLKG